METTRGTLTPGEAMPTRIALSLGRTHPRCQPGVEDRDGCQDPALASPGRIDERSLHATPHQAASKDLRPECAVSTRSCMRRTTAGRCVQESGDSRDRHEE